MIKYIPEDTSVTFVEIPDAICLCINLSNCPHRCPGCHSEYLQRDIGKELTEEVLDSLIHKNDGITCVVFMGGDSDKVTLMNLAKYITINYNVLIGWYSGESELDLNNFGRYFNYIKVGPYIKSKGPLNVQTTNQRMYYNEVKNNEVISKDITHQFWR